MVKEALDLYFANKNIEQSPFELGQDLFGTSGSNDGNLSTSFKRRLKGKLRAKHSD